MNSVQTVTWPLLLFEQTGDLDVDVVKKPEKTGTRPGRIHCHACKHEITDHTQQTERSGNHCHRRTNPSGYIFEFGCFATASGCGVVGEAMSEFSWFQGYRWQIAVCRGCGEHIGWLFRGSDSFYGLILSRLISSDDQRL